MDERFYELLGEACRHAKIPNTETVTDREALDLDTWADKVLALAYASGDYEISGDTTEMKKHALSVKHAVKSVRIQKKHSDIVAQCKALVSDLSSYCEKFAPDYSVYLESRLRLGHR